MPCIFLQEVLIYQKQHLSTHQAYLFNLELSTAVLFLPIRFSHYFIHNLATGSVGSLFYRLLDRDNFFLISWTRLWSLTSHTASLTASPVPERLEQPILSLLQTPILLLLGSAPTSPTDMSTSDFNRSAHEILQALTPVVSTSNYEKPFWLQKNPWKHKADVLKRFNLESTEKHRATLRCTWFWSQFNISGWFHLFNFSLNFKSRH